MARPTAGTRHATGRPVVDADTFLLAWRVPVDGFRTGHPTPERRPGPAAALSRGERVALAAFGRWGVCRGEPAAYRDARPRPGRLIARELRAIHTRRSSRPRRG